jgi:transcriptional regulator
VYLPPAFAETDPAAIGAIIAAHSLAQLVVVGPDGLVASPVPMLVRGAIGTDGWRLAGHVAKANPVLVPGPALAIFTGVEAYISPSAYATKREHGRVVPTWNYETVQVHGELVLHLEPEWILELVSELTNRHESKRTEPWQVTDAPADYVNGLLRAIVGIELAVTKVTAKRKLSQNQPVANADGVRAQLSAGTPSDRAAAAAMPPR